MMHSLIRALCIWFLAAPLMGQERPNVIFVMPDDISHHHFSYYYDQGPRTPNIDRLAGESLRLTDFHVSPTCAPTRGALMTGRDNNVVGVWHTISGRNQLRADEITMADVFKANGYTTGMFFKWHLGDNYPFRPGDRGFEYVAWTKGGGVGQQPDYWGNTNQALWAWVNDSLVEMSDEYDGLHGKFSTNFFFNRAFEFMEGCIDQGKPFFAYIPPATAHNPQFMPPDARSGIDSKTATVENIDKNMGRLMQWLEDKDIAKNTILIFTTDNGNNTFLRGSKSSHYDGGTRVPCFVRWENGGLGGPGKGRDVKPLTAHIDWLPTFMDLLDLEDAVESRPEKLRMHGMSIKPFLDEDPDNDPESLKNRCITIANMRGEIPYKYSKFSVKKDFWDGDKIIHKWRLVGNKDSRELYDVQKDIKQDCNIIHNKTYAAIVSELKAEYELFWALVAERSDEYTRVIVGHPAEPLTRLNSHDFHSGFPPPWNQQLVATGEGKNAFIAIAFHKAGSYHFDLRRWPREVEEHSTLTSIAPPELVYNGKTKPVAVAIRNARIKIWSGDEVYVDESKEADPNEDGVTFTVENLPQGPAFIQTWFYGADGAEVCPVYYNYAQHDDAEQVSNH